MDEDTCLACGGQLEALGALGNRRHYRCRNCGLDTSFETTPPPTNKEKRPERSNAQ
jgi:tRNA(Ile2) C34 agmatinyltransferase TiaS